MLLNEYIYYSNRAETDEHKTSIKSSYSKRTSSIMRLIDRVFKHHCAVFAENVSPYITVTADHSKRINDEYISNLFYYKYFVEPTIHLEVSTKTSVIPLDNFIDKILEHPDDPTKNRLNFLLGDVGCGKTAFVNYFLTNRSQTWLKKRLIWFIRIDAHLAGAGSALTYEQLIDALVDKTIRIMDNIRDIMHLPNGFTVLADLRNTKGNTREQERVLAKLFKEVKLATGIRPFLIIDNLDQIYHDSDSERYKDLRINNDTIKSIEKLISTFYQDGSSLGRISANILFVLRHETYDAVRKIERVFRPHNIFLNNQNAYTLQTADWHEIISQRSLLLKEISNIYYGPGKERDAEQIINPIIDNVRLKHSYSGLTLIDQLIELSNFGLRSVVEFFAKYSWIYPDEHYDSSVIDRYMRQFPIGLLAFLLNGLLRYSQTRSLFTNIYLVYSEKPFPHSYWLKRLIVEYIWKKELLKEEVSFDSIIAIFCGEKKDGYPEELVKECLGSLSEAHGSNIIRPKLKVAEQPQRLRPSILSLTRRGKHAIEHLFDKFIYLQLIIDDYNLQIPNIIASKFSYQDSVDYAYIVLPPDKYTEAARKIITIKAEQVLLFIELLATSYEFEEMIYPQVFHRLNLHGVNVDVDNIRTNVGNELRKLGDRDKLLNLNDKLEIFYSDCQKIRDALSNFYLNLVQ